MEELRDQLRRRIPARLFRAFVAQLELDKAVVRDGSLLRLPDYTITLSRLPEGVYIGLAAVTHYSHAGVATGVATLFDENGPIGSGMATALANPGFTPPPSIVVS